MPSPWRAVEAGTDPSGLTLFLGAPTHNPVSGRLVGIIDLTSPLRIAHPRSLELVTTAARSTEQ